MSKKTLNTASIFLYLLIGIACVTAGVHGLQEAADNAHPLKMPLSAYLRERPSNKWVELTNCHILYSRAVGYRMRLGQTVASAFVPVYPSGAPTGGPIPLVLEMSQMEKSDVPNRRDEDHATLAGGLWREGIFDKHFDPKLLDVGNWTMHDKFTILHQNTRPDDLVVFIFIVGAAMFASGGVTYTKMKKQTVADQNAAPITPPSYADPLVTAARFRELTREAR